MLDKKEPAFDAVGELLDYIRLQGARSVDIFGRLKSEKVYTIISVDDIRDKAHIIIIYDVVGVPSRSNHRRKRLIGLARAKYG